MRDYEITVIVSPAVGDENVEAVVDRVGQYVAGAGGEVGVGLPADLLDVAA